MNHPATTAPTTTDPGEAGVRDSAWMLLRALGRAFDARSLGARHWVEQHIETLIAAWCGLLIIAAVAKVATAVTPAQSAGMALIMAAPFLLVGIAPVFGYRMTMLVAAPAPRGRLGATLAAIGRWRPAALGELRRQRLQGPTGVLVSLIIGLLLNVPMRSLEFFAMAPAINPGDPLWARAFLMALSGNMVVMNALYMACFVSALRMSPLFPRLLVTSWIVDAATQLAMGLVLMRMPEMPYEVRAALGVMIRQNLELVGISALLWAPYLLLSSQVNLLFRHRVRVAS